MSLTFEELFTGAELDVRVPNAALRFPSQDTLDVDKWLEELEESDRSQAFFDEHLQAILTVRIPHENPASSTAATPTTSAPSSPKPSSHLLQFLSHLQISLEASYIPQAPTIEGGRIEESSSKNIEPPLSPRPLTATPRSPRPGTPSVPLSASLSASASSSDLTVPPRHTSLKKPVNLSLNSPNALAPPGKKQVHHPSILPPATPNPLPASTTSDARYALPGAAEQGIMLVGGAAGGVIWGQNVGTGKDKDSGENMKGLKKGLDQDKESFALLWSPSKKMWVAVYRMVLDVAFLRLPFMSPLLCLTISSTLRDKPTTSLEKYFSSLGLLPSPYPNSPGPSPSGEGPADDSSAANEDPELSSAFHIGNHPTLPQILPLKGPPEVNLLGGLYGISGFRAGSGSSPVDTHSSQPNPFTASPTTATSGKAGSKSNSPASATFTGNSGKANTPKTKEGEGQKVQILSLPSTRLGPATRVDLFCLPAEPSSPSPSSTSLTFADANNTANASTTTLTSAPPKSPRTHRPTSTQDKRELARQLMGGTGSGRTTPSSSVDNSRPSTPSTSASASVSAASTGTSVTSVSAPGTPTTTTPGTSSTARLGTPVTGTILTLKKSFRKTLENGDKDEDEDEDEEAEADEGKGEDAQADAKRDEGDDEDEEGDDTEDREDLLASGSSERTVVLCVEVENEVDHSGYSVDPGAASFVIERVDVSIGGSLSSAGVKGTTSSSANGWGESGARTRLIGWDDLSFAGSDRRSKKSNKSKSQKTKTTDAITGTKPIVETESSSTTPAFTTATKPSRPKLRFAGLDSSDSIHDHTRLISQNPRGRKKKSKHFPLLLAPNEQHNLLYAVSFLRAPEEEAAESLAGLTGLLGGASAGNGGGDHVSGAPPTAGFGGVSMPGGAAGPGGMAGLQRSVTINIFGRPCFKVLKRDEDEEDEHDGDESSDGSPQLTKPITPISPGSSASSSMTDIMNLDDSGSADSMSTPTPISDESKRRKSNIKDGGLLVTTTTVSEETLLFPTTTFSTKWNCVLDLSSSFTQPPYRTSQHQPMLPPIQSGKPQFTLPFEDDNDGANAGPSTTVLPEPPSPFPVSVSGNFPTSSSFRSSTSFPSGLGSSPVSGSRDRRSLGTDIAVGKRSSVGPGVPFATDPVKRHTLPNPNAPGFPQRPNVGGPGPRTRASLTPSLPSVPSGQVNSIPFGSVDEVSGHSRDKRDSGTPSLRERKDSGMGSKLRERRDSLLSLMNRDKEPPSITVPPRSNTGTPVQHYYTPPSVTQSHLQSHLRSPTTYEPPPLPDKDYLSANPSAPGQSIDQMMGIGEPEYLNVNTNGLGVNVGLPPMTPAYPAFPGNINTPSFAPQLSAIPPTPPSQAPLIPQGGNFGGPTAGAYNNGPYAGQSVDVKRERGVINTMMGSAVLPTPTPRPVVGVEGGFFGAGYDSDGQGGGGGGGEKGVSVGEGESVIVSVGLLNKPNRKSRKRQQRRQAEHLEEEQDSDHTSSDSESEANSSSDDINDSPGSEFIYPLDTFTLDIFVFNRSSWTRRFEITCPDSRERRKRLEREMIIGLNQKGLRKNQRRSGAATAAALMAMEKEKTRGPGVLPLENRVRIGPLLPSACQSVRMKFLAVSPGVHAIDTLTLTDIESGFSMNLRSVMDIVVHEH
ncbi:hypothetical protein K435DRAFT_875060 [Dendrothele bispora CBS 962.96]|uniref:Trafficking protein particle complex II-specific subunit 65 IgD3 domain-containing protein n=1 Tax=Dendrothele bispora (strain CBS 962.96) TaxID=1314807 RepID=A0A4S8KVI9_DENBC|nr:hypothetical protein K435DRAFT_875060 [Dendrothele bispora CBS 962.96]